MAPKVTTKRKKPKNKAAQEMARKRARSLTPERRSEIGKLAIAARWAKDKARKEAESTILD